MIHISYFKRVEDRGEGKIDCERERVQKWESKRARERDRDGWRLPLPLTPLLIKNSIKRSNWRFFSFSWICPVNVEGATMSEEEDTQSIGSCTKCFTEWWVLFRQNGSMTFVLLWIWCLQHQSGSGSFQCCSHCQLLSPQWRFPLSYCCQVRGRQVRFEQHGRWS